MTNPVAAPSTSVQGPIANPAEPQVTAPSIDVRGLWENNPLLKGSEELQPVVSAHFWKAAKHYTLAGLSILVVAIISVVALALVCLFAIELIPFVFIGAYILLELNTKLFFLGHYREAKDVWAKHTFENRVIQQIGVIQNEFDLLSPANQAKHLEKIEKELVNLTKAKKVADDEIAKLTPVHTNLINDYNALDAQHRSLTDPEARAALGDRMIPAYGNRIKMERRLAVLNRVSRNANEDLAVLNAKKADLTTNPLTPATSLEKQASYLQELHESIGAIPLSDKKIDLIAQLKNFGNTDPVAKKVNAYSALIPVIARALVHRELETNKALENIRHLFLPLTNEEGIIPSYQTDLYNSYALRGKGNKTPAEIKRLRELDEGIKNCNRDLLQQRHMYYGGLIHSIYLASIASNPFANGHFDSVGTVVPFDPATDSVTREINGGEVPLFEFGNNRHYFSRVDLHNDYMRTLGNIATNPQRDIKINRIIDKVREERAQDVRSYITTTGRQINQNDYYGEYLMVNGLSPFIEKEVARRKLNDGETPLDPENQSHFEAIVAFKFPGRNTPLTPAEIQDINNTMDTYYNVPAPLVV